MEGEFKRLNLLRLSSLREGFFSRQPAPIFGEAIFMARITSMKDCFVVPPRNDDLSFESDN
ncbi:hypothetical protein QF042_002521 [Pedobacter sp. W3I1]|nr:hypothetical protein [Pedobacter sp. W3I1]